MQPEAEVLRQILKKKKRENRPFRISLRYKLALPVLLLVTAMILLLFKTTFNTVGAVVREHNERRLQAIADVFAETVKVPLILLDQQVMQANIEWMSKRPDVLEVRVEDVDGTIVGGEISKAGKSLSATLDKNFLGVRRVGQDIYAVAVPIRARDRRIGRVFLLFSQQGFELELKQIFEQRLLLAFILALCLAALIGGVTWVAIRPLFILKRTAQKVLGGDLTARADVDSFDEFQDMGNAFNEMMARLSKSLDNLRSRTEALEESEEKYRLVVDNASDIILTLTPEGEIALLNKDISGCKREELLIKGLPHLLLLHTDESRKKFEEALEKLCRIKQPVTNLAITHIHEGNQSEIAYLVNLTPLLDHEGMVKWIQGVMRDVTELRRIEMMKESLIRDVAHELKTPTAKFEMAVGWFEKELQRNQEQEKYAEVVKILKSNTDRLMRTITSIMDLSKLESGVDTLVRKELDLNQVLEEVCRDMEPLCRSKNLALESSFHNGLVLMRGDHDMLYRLFVNLISNAVKFTPAGKIKITSQKIEDRILVSVKDTGMGIEKEDLEKIFERFFQKSAASVGIGVGLTISRDIAALHEGKIWAESEGAGQGAVFKVEFPGL